MLLSMAINVVASMHTEMVQDVPTKAKVTFSISYLFKHADTHEHLRSLLRLSCKVGHE